MKLLELKNRTILVMDDEEGIRDILRYELEYLGAHVLEAEDGQIGLNQIRTQRVDVVLCDMHMPNMNGFEFLRALKDMAQAPPVFVLSGFSDYPEEKLLAAGARGVFAKPFLFDEIITEILGSLVP